MRILRTMLLAIAVAFGLAGLSHAGVIINFAGFAANTDIPTGYASNVSADETGLTVNSTDGVTGAPNLALNWSASTGLWQFHTFAPTAGAGQLDNLAVGEVFTIRFTPDAGWAASLNAFTLNTLGNGDGLSTLDVDWDLFNVTSASSLGSGNVSYVNTPGANSPTNVGLTGGLGDVLELRFSSDNGPYPLTQFAIMLDDLDFNQVAIPEPSAFILAAVGLVGLASVGRRRKK